MYRPEGWVEITEDLRQRERYNVPDMEAGADAVMSAIIRENKERDFRKYMKDAFELLPDYKYRILKGTWVFIPDEVS